MSARRARRRSLNIQSQAGRPSSDPDRASAIARIEQVREGLAERIEEWRAKADEAETREGQTEALLMLASCLLGRASIYIPIESTLTDGLSDLNDRVTDLMGLDVPELAEPSLLESIGGGQPHA